VGEAPFGIASTPGRGSALEFAVQRLGGVTTELHELGDGDIIGVRGPLGNWFPMDDFKGKDILVLGGGIGGAPLRPVLQTIFDNRYDYGKLTILWAARHPDLLIFRDEYTAWRETPNTELHLTVDEADESWDGEVGLITQLLEKVNPVLSTRPCKSWALRRSNRMSRWRRACTAGLANVGAATWARS
jgi:NAD(P)H-flavin reductase